MNIRDLRNEERSIYYNIVSIFSDWTSVAILTSRDDVEKSLPCIVIEYQHSLPRSKELGDKDLKEVNSFYIFSCYATKEGELMDMLDKLYKGLSATFNLLDYTTAFPTQTGYNATTQKTGTLDAYDIDVIKVTTGLESISLVDRFRGQVSCRLRRNK